jgi:hypothetical protein
MLKSRKHTKRWPSSTTPIDVVIPRKKKIKQPRSTKKFRRLTESLETNKSALNMTWEPTQKMTPQAWEVAAWVALAAAAWEVSTPVKSSKCLWANTEELEVRLLVVACPEEWVAWKIFSVCSVACQEVCKEVVEEAVDLLEGVAVEVVACPDFRKPGVAEVVPLFPSTCETN